jgi:hypothetical protein
MRSRLALSAFAVAALAAFINAAFVTSAVAGTYDHDHVYADSFGNLVVESAAGYKRILIGEGAMAKKLAAYTSAGQINESHGGAARLTGARDCYRPPVFVKGCSYMYGLSDGEMPELSPCR